MNYTNVISILQRMPLDNIRAPHKFILAELSGMFSDCTLPKFSGTPKFNLFYKVDKQGVFQKCNIISFSRIFSRLIFDGITSNKLSFGHDGIDEFFVACSNSMETIKVKDPELYHSAKYYLNSVYGNIVGNNPTYQFFGDLEGYFNANYFDKMHEIINSPLNSDQHILVFDTDMIIIDSRVPALETEIQTKLNFSNSLYQSEVVIDNKLRRSKGYKIGRGVVE